MGIIVYYRYPIFLAYKPEAAVHALEIFQRGGALLKPGPLDDGLPKQEVADHPRCVRHRPDGDEPGVPLGGKQEPHGAVVRRHPLLEFLKGTGGDIPHGHLGYRVVDRSQAHGRCHRTKGASVVAMSFGNPAGMMTIPPAVTMGLSASVDCRIM